jgi:hypothetical protein
MAYSKAKLKSSKNEDLPSDHSEYEMHQTSFTYEVLTVGFIYTRVPICPIFPGTAPFFSYSVLLSWILL